MKLRWLSLGFAAVFVTALWSESSPAQLEAGRPASPLLPVPGRNVAVSDDATALRLNPALLQAAPGGELRLESFADRLNETVRYAGFAAGLSGKVPLLGWGVGVRYETVAHPLDENGDERRRRQDWLTAGLSMPAGHTSAFGLGLHRSFSADPVSDALTAISLGYIARPLDALALGVTADNLGSASNGLTSLPTTFTGGLVVRPLGERALEVGVEGSYQPAAKRAWPRATVGLDIDGVGRVRADVSRQREHARTTWFASAAFSVDLNTERGSLEATAGSLYRNQGSSAWAGYASLATRGFREPAALSAGRYAVTVGVEETPSARDHIALLAHLWALADEPELDAVVLRLRASPASSLAHLEELRDAVFELRRAGKRTLCHLEDASGAALFLCAAASRVLINPAGSVRFSGVKTQSLYFAEGLRKLGIRAEFVRVGAHKSAPEQFTQSEPGEVARADRIDLLQQSERAFVEGVSLGRGLSVATLRQALKEGPFDAPRAQAHGLVDELVFDDQIAKSVKKATGRDTQLLGQGRARIAPKRFGQSGVIAVVHVDGEITDGRNRSLPFIGSRSAGSYTLLDTLKAVRDNDQVRGVIVRVDSPGGSSTAADVLWRQVKLTAERKPTVVSMGSTAASGGYYLSVAADRIFANPQTITGSIGIYSLNADLSGLLRMLGVDHETYVSQPSADADSLFRAMSAAERASQQARINTFYELFLRRVAEGRNMKRDAVDAVGQGRIWTGEQAKERGLVDELGGLRQALAYVRSQAHLDADCPVVLLPKSDGSLLGKLLGLPFLNATGSESDTSLRVSSVDPSAVESLSQRTVEAASSASWLPPGLAEPLRAVAPLMFYAPETPLARLPFQPPELR